MGSKRAMLGASLQEGENLAEHTHIDRRATPEQRQKEEKKAKKRVPIWVKESVLAYEKELHELQIELLKLQNHVKEKGEKILLIFEGRDAAGKGGTIKRITEYLNPRGARIVALDKPSDRQKTQWYFQRYTPHLPSAGEIVLFDRSWYNRAGVEPVMGFCTAQEHQTFLNEVGLFEQMLVNSGVKLFKFYFSVSKEEQKKRFKKRATDPLKQFKLSPVDMKSQKLWDEYTKMKFLMLTASHTDFAPWTIIRSDNKKQARLNTIRHILQALTYKHQKEIAPTDPQILVRGDVEITLMQAKRAAE